MRLGNDDSYALASATAPAPALASAPCAVLEAKWSYKSCQDRRLYIYINMHIPFARTDVGQLNNTQTYIDIYLYIYRERYIYLHMAACILLPKPYEGRATVSCVNICAQKYAASPA